MADQQPDDKEVEFIARCFAEIFELAHVGPDEDFFDLGGDSLLGESLAARISEHVGREFQICSIVENSTPRKIAAFLRGSGAAQRQRGARPPIFLVHGMLGIMLPRPEFLHGLAPGQKLRMFELPGIRGGKAHTTIEAIASDYVSQLQSEYPSGPVLLGGFCRGSLIAIEMATQLEELGRPVMQMVLFDPGNAPATVLRHFRLATRRALGKKDAGPKSWQSRRWYRQQLIRLKYLLTAGHWTDGNSPEDFKNENIRRLREQHYKRALSGEDYATYREKMKGQDLSRDAQAKLLAAYDHFLPRPFSGPVAIFASRSRIDQFRDKSSFWSYLLPNREIHELGATHSEVIRASAATGARLMQAIFDAAVLRDAGTGSRGAKSGDSAPSQAC